MENNNVTLSGFISDEAKYSHTKNGTYYYNTVISIARLSEKFDHIPLVIPGKLILPVMGDYVSIKGRFVSQNQRKNGKNTLVLYVLVDELSLSDNIHFNDVAMLHGFICKEPYYRKTPLGKTLCDVLLAVNDDGKSNYIPTIFWGIHASWTRHLPVGTELKVEGRIQSREYLKKYDDGTSETKTAYELSVFRSELVEVEDI